MDSKKSVGPKSKLVAVVLWIFGGLFSVHNLYLGRVKES